MPETTSTTTAGVSRPPAGAPGRSVRRRLTSALAVLAVAPLLALTACSGGEPEAAPTPGSSATPEANPPADPSASASPSPSATPTPTPEPVEPSSDLGEVEVSGDFGDAPEVTVETPWAVDETRTRVLVEGDGQPLQATGSAQLNYQGVNARTGEVFDSSYERGEPVTFGLTQVVPGFQKGLEGQKIGSRVLIAMPGTDGYDASGGNPQAGIEVGDTLLFTVDILAGTLTSPVGEEVEPPADLPTVTGAVDDPQIAVPEGTPPTELVSQLLVEGTGPEVGENDTITVDVRGVPWETGEVTIDSYPDAPKSDALNELIEGWKQGLVGKKIGSRVLLVVPPDLGYGDTGNEDPAVEPGQTMVYVVDLLWTEAPPTVPGTGG
ncbi:peptidylprolyl isomerase [Desertihabitans brevis]|uniref:peptidylprolyl isomerase n=1 Tax=Desertihabitans brevis TaxID=2268447 RepID=A0A367Z0N3_9ACTN|nr:FKBP-type peptidyl-prolyl cis-trans isomerase [Desertihabitans brevis]RCK71447.1 peptidylprolyl isomerase [Desertihabitans brevis]